MLEIFKPIDRESQQRYGAQWNSHIEIQGLGLVIDILCTHKSIHYIIVLTHGGLHVCILSMGLASTQVWYRSASDDVIVRGM